MKVMDSGALMRVRRMRELIAGLRGDRKMSISTKPA